MFVSSFVLSVGMLKHMSIKIHFVPLKKYIQENKTKQIFTEILIAAIFLIKKCLFLIYKTWLKKYVNSAQMNSLADVVKKKMISMNQSCVIFRVYREVRKTDLENILVVRVFFNEGYKIFIHILKHAERNNQTVKKMVIQRE